MRFKYLSWNDPAFLISNFNVYANADRATADTESAILATDPVYTLTDIRYAEPNWKEVEISGVRGTEGGTHILFHVNGKVCKRFSITGLEVEEYTAVPPHRPTLRQPPPPTSNCRQTSHGHCPRQPPTALPSPTHRLSTA